MAKKTVTEEEVTETTEEITEETVTETTEEEITRVYIGPSIPHTTLRNAQILTGTETSIGEYLAQFTERYPEVPFLIVAPAGLAEAQRRVQTAGNILHKYYEDMAAKARVQKER